MRHERIEVTCSCGAHGIIESDMCAWVTRRYHDFLEAHEVCRVKGPRAETGPQPITRDPGEVQ